jgi:hypothetical protein
MTPQQERFLEKVELIPPSDCWFWTGAVMSLKSPRPVPAVKINGKVQNARRASFELFIGEIWDESLRAITTCGGHLCVRPEHIDLVEPNTLCQPGRLTQARRSKERTHFRCGHEIAPDNSYVKSGEGGVGSCLACRKLSKRLKKRSKSKKPQPFRWVENKEITHAR